MVQLPEGWKWTTLGEALKWGSGGTPLKSKPEYYGGNIPWVIIGDLNDGIVTETKSTISQKGLMNSSAKWVDEGSVLIAMYGSIGKLGLAGKRLTTNQAIAFAKGDSVNSKYAFYYLLGERINLLNLGVGATQQNISQTKLKAYPFPLPPLDEQERIVAKIESLFSQLDAGVAALQRIQAALKRYKASVLKAAFEGRLVPQDPNDEPAEALLRRLGKAPVEDENLPSLPEGWCWTKLEDITKKIKDVDHKMPKPAVMGFPYVSTKDFIGEDGIDFDNAKIISECDFLDLSRKIRPELGDVLLSRYGTIGKIRKVRTSRNFQASYSIAIIKTFEDKGLADYIATFLQSDTAQKQIRENIKASSQPDLGLEYIRKILVPLAPYKEQGQLLEEIDKRISIILEVETIIEEQFRRASHLRQTILKQAFQGKLL